MASQSKPAVLAALLVAAWPAQLRGMQQQESRVAAQASEAPKLDATLRDRMAAAPEDAFLPVWFALSDRLPDTHWFPRVQNLPLQQRRATVMAELKAHAQETQRALRSLLAESERTGEARSVRSNWLGNFVQCLATKAAIERAAALPRVAYAKLDSEPERDAVEDGSTHAPFADLHTAEPMAATTLPAPGDGPMQTRAFVAWAYGFRGQGVVIANVDGGISQHNDLDARRWINQGEITANGIDDDQNGFVDDVHGYAFDTSSSQLDDGGGHGTMTAGLLVGDGSCSGIAHGQAPAAQLMTCRTLSETSQWNAIQYAIAMGADVQTSSFSYKANFAPPPDYRMHRDVAAASLAAGLIRVNSSGNDGAFAADPSSALRVPCNIAAPACVPSPYLDPAQANGGRGGVIAVGAFRVAQNAIDPVSPRGPFAWSLADVRQNVPSYPAAQWDLARHEDYPWQNGAQSGLMKPDVLGPTGTTTTSGSPCRTTVFSGTSNAAPCVAGVIALWKSANPSITPEDAAMLLHQTSLDLGFVPGKENRFGAGLIDAERGLRRALCVHRIDSDPAYHTSHPIGSGPVRLDLDGVPNSLAVFAVAAQRMPQPIGSLQLGIGPIVDIVAFGVTDQNGDMQTTAPVGQWLQGLTVATQAVLLDQTHTNTLLESNVVELSFH
jgi:subtilisin family serine protease